ncbi:MAG: DsbE family thiol:disulfide interchange protein [Cardiobacteriaceae bacterium]|nr:DsbE family thiol:disulfide interchange protein [Cardiobacteriaceae bacterium]
MKPKNLSLAFILLISFAILILFFARGLGKNPQELPSVLIGKTLPTFTLPSLDTTHQYTNHDLPQQTPYLLNIWGSWCPACQQEHPYLLELAHNIPIIGLNWPADNPNEEKDAAALLTHNGNPYQLNLSDPHGDLITSLGVYGAPETFLIDKNGTILYRHAGPLNADIWTNEISPLLKKTP